MHRWERDLSFTRARRTCWAEPDPSYFLSAGRPIGSSGCGTWLASSCVGWRLSASRWLVLLRPDQSGRAYGKDKVKSRKNGFNGFSFSRVGREISSPLSKLQARASRHMGMKGIVRSMHPTPFQCSASSNTNTGAFHVEDSSKRSLTVAAFILVVFAVFLFNQTMQIVQAARSLNPYSGRR